MLDNVYGYEIKDGTYRVQKTEARFVRNAFERYINGTSTSMISKYFNEMNISTRKKNGRWTHTMIINMLKNRRYCGELGYPQIVSKSIQEEAIKRLHDNNFYKGRIDAKKLNLTSPFYKMMECRHCGNRIWLYEYDGIYYWCATKTKTKCALADYRKKIGILDEELHRCTLELINELIEDPEIIQHIENFNYNNLDVVKVENQIKQLLRNETNNVREINEYLKKKYELLYERYDEDNISETIILKKNLSLLPIQERVKREVLISLIRKIQIDKEGVVIFILRNGQIFEKNITIGKVIKNG